MGGWGRPHWRVWASCCEGEGAGEPAEAALPPRSRLAACRLAGLSPLTQLRPPSGPGKREHRGPAWRWNESLLLCPPPRMGWGLQGFRAFLVPALASDPDPNPSLAPTSPPNPTPTPVLTPPPP